MLDITKISSKYHVRKLSEDDINLIINVCLSNELFYKYTNATPTKEAILEDMKLTPPNVDINNKYYVGFFEKDTLVAIMDLIDEYPNNKYAYIGFFMMNKIYQGKQIGSTIISEVIDFLKQMKKEYVRLAIDDGNPQSMHFWKKNGFIIIYEKNIDNYKKYVAEKKII